MQFSGAILITIMAVVVLTAAFDATKHDEYMRTCIQDEGATIEELAKLKSGQLQPNDASDKVKCFTKCLMEKHGIYKNGALLEDELMKEFADVPLKENAKMAFNKCKSIKGANECDTAFEIANCMAHSNVKML